MPVMKAILVGLAAALFVCAAVSAIALRETAERRAELARDSALAGTAYGSVEYAEWGSGPAVLVIHGAGGGFDQGRLLAESIGAEGFRYIAVSRFGYLRSSMPADAGPAAQADALAELLDHLGVDRAHILAMSGGVPPALSLAARHPDRVDRMILLSSAPYAPDQAVTPDRPIPTWLYSVLLGNDVAYWTLSRTARGALREAFDARSELLAVASVRERVFVDRLVEGFLPASARLPGLINEGAAIQPGAHIALEMIRAPVLVVHAEDDRMNPAAVGAALAAGIPGAQHMEFESGGHLLLGRHDELRARFGGWLRPQD